MQHKDHDSFLSELTKLFEASRDKGKSVWITIKRYDGRTTRLPRKSNDKARKGSKTQQTKEQQNIPSEYKCLIRAKLGDRKISAVISQKEMDKFQQSYSNLMKKNITGLKKRSKPL